MTVTDQPSTPFDLPDSAVAVAAMRLCAEVSQDFVYNHTVRSYLFARELAAVDGAGDLDEELVFLACVLHDLGVTDYANGDQRFEVDAADAAARFLRGNGVDEGRVQTVWNAIALHTSPGLAHRFGIIEGTAQRGIAADVVGQDRDRLRDGFADRVHAQWPRFDLAHALSRQIAQQVHDNPAKGLPLTFPDQMHRQYFPESGSLSWFDIIEAAGWGDRPPRVDA